jgi:dihydrofolate synthase / folylpolyglutamate synthase
METSFKTIGEIEAFLEQVPKFGSAGIAAANFNLDRMKRFCRLMGNPEKQFSSIHVAGTNGKGTVCQMLASVYQTAGYKTGLYTSPHLLHVRERFRTDGEVMNDESLLKFFSIYGDDVVRERLTFFELTTAMAFWHFAETDCEIAIIETGLGGRLDATNVITPLCSVITSIGMDHADILGDSIEKIAAEKAGIIKPKVPVITGNLPGVANVVIESRARELDCLLYKASELTPEFSADGIRLTTGSGPLIINAEGRKRIDSVNAATVFQAVRAISEIFHVSDRHIVEGIEKADSRFPHHAHFEKLMPGRWWYFDGAHNIEATEVLIDELLAMAPPENWTVVLSYMKDKLTPELVGLWHKFPNILLYSQETKRAATVADMQEYLPSAREFSPERWVENRDSDQLKSELVIFSGSFYFYEKVRRWTGTKAAR